MSWPTNRTFDPLTQEFTVLAPDGRTPMSIPLEAVQVIQSVTVAKGICVGTQIGAATLVLITLLLVTKKDKRRSLVFILNALALFIVIIKGILEGTTYTGPIYEWYRIAAVYYADTEQARAVTACAELSSVLLYIVLELSLVLQVRIVCCTLETIWRHTVNIFNMFVAVLVVGARIGLAGINIKWNIIHVAQETLEQRNRIYKLASAVSILFVVSIGISATIFSAKLAHAIHRRHLLGIKQFGPMQTIFIMGCQTMIAPFIFILVCFYGITSIKLQSFAPVVVALLLPLSALWAAANANNTKTSDNAAPFARNNVTSGKAYGATRKRVSDTDASSDGSEVARISAEDHAATVYSNVEIEKMEEGRQYPCR